MEPSILSYLSLVIAVISLGVSIYAITRKPSVIVKEVMVGKQPKDNFIREDVKKEKKEVVVETSQPEVQLKTADVKLETLKEPKPVVENKSGGPLINTWYLEITGPEGAPYNIQIEWSDGSSDIESGVIPEEETFKHPAGVVPIKVVGIPPNGDRGAIYLWELNGFHWS